MSEAELMARIEKLEAQLRNLQDIEEIKKLQRAYGYYIEHWMAPEILDLFCDRPDVTLTLTPGSFVGKDHIREYFEGVFDHTNPEFLHQVMQLNGYVSIDPDGESAKGRWYAWGVVAVPMEQGVYQSFMDGTYVCDYVKEDGVWKIYKLEFNLLAIAKPAEGWVKPDRLSTKAFTGGGSRMPKPDVPRAISTRYPSGYIVPFHFKHPVTGKETSEGIRNDSLPETT